MKRAPNRNVESAQTTAQADLPVHDNFEKIITAIFKKLILDVMCIEKET